MRDEPSNLWLSFFTSLATIESVLVNAARKEVQNTHRLLTDNRIGSPAPPGMSESSFPSAIRSAGSILAGLQGGDLVYPRGCTIRRGVEYPSFTKLITLPLV